MGAVLPVGRGREADPAGRVPRPGRLLALDRSRIPMPLTRKTPPRLLYLALPLMVIALSGCAALYPPQSATSQGDATRRLYDIVFFIAAVIFFAVEGAIVWIVLRYRRKPTDSELPSQFHGNNLIEIIWTVIPTVIVLFLFVISYQTLNTVEAKDTRPVVNVRVEAQRFAWSFVYRDANDRPLVTDPDGKEHVYFGTLEVPPGVPIHVTLFSPDVIHAFYVPKFLFKRDVVPLQDNSFDFTVDPGDAGQTFHGQCAELCGIGHGGMTFDIHATASLAAFQTWLQAQIDTHGQGPAPAASAPPSGSTAPGGSTAPSGNPAPPASSSPAAAGPTIQLAANNLTFDKNAIEATANQPFSIVFANNDAGVPHNVDILDSGGAILFNGPIVTGPKTVTYQVQALPAGTYPFRCVVHPAQMTGTLTVK
jgi:cytochrome c oxidase subunit 2